MNLQTFLDSISEHYFILTFLYLSVPVITMFLNKGFEGQGERGTVAYVYAILVYGTCIPGLFSACVWFYSMIFEQKSLIQLNPFIYYLPVLSMIGSLYLIKQNVRLWILPWFGELYELFGILCVSFWLVLIALSREVLPFQEQWQIWLFLIFVFILCKLIWDYFEAAMLRKSGIKIRRTR